MQPEARPGGIRSILVPIAREGRPFIAIGLALTAAGYWVAHPLGTAALVLTAWCVYFFRDPERVTPRRDGLLVAPADGVILSIGTVPPPEQLRLGEQECLRISTFMNVFDCHVNRLPCSGRIGTLHYVPGRFVNASLDKASEQNERQLVRVDRRDGRAVGLVQIAGLVARRIVCRLHEGQEVTVGDRFGLIRFGSRVDVYLPADALPLVEVGQRSIAGETVLAALGAGEPLVGMRSGEESA
ncbi:MAG: phosphatidylserine decarboxylase [Alphaproteobacteria bacterium]|nr:phosphatidylserine decarboxylase [Alphaproteobacteria bacterium]